MRQFAVSLALLVILVGSARAGKVEVRGLAIYSEKSKQAAVDAISSAKGISKVSTDLKKRSITFEAKDQDAAQEACSGLEKAGFSFGQVTKDEKADFGILTEYSILKRVGEPIELSPPKANEVKLSGVYVYDETCEKVIVGLFKDSKVTFSGKDNPKEMTVKGMDLTAFKVYATMRDAGFDCRIIKKAK